MVVLARSYGSEVTTVKRGPQCVQVMNGCRWRRSAGSASSRRQSSQVAVSGETRVRPGPPAEGRMVNPWSPLVRVRRGARRTRRRRAAGAGPDPRAEVGDGPPRALHFGDDPVRVVGDPSRQAELLGEGVDEGPEADALHDTADGDPACAPGSGPPAMTPAPVLRTVPSRMAVQMVLSCCRASTGVCVSSPSAPRRMWASRRRRPLRCGRRSRGPEHRG